MTQRSSKGLGEALTFPGYIKETTTQSINDCVYVLRSKPKSAFMWYNLRVLFPTNKASDNEVRFEIEYYRQSRRSNRSAQLVQRLRGVLYRDSGQTHLMAKVNFTAGALLWLWLALALTLVSIGLLLYTRNVVMFGLIGMTGAFMGAMALVLWLDRYYLKRFVRRILESPRDI